MSNTHFHDNYTEIVKNRAYSYERGPLFTYSNSILSYSNAGATSLFTNIDDLSKWVMNFYKPVVGSPADIEQLVQKGKLNNGTELSYALGISSDKYKGWRQYSHSGGDAGFRTYITVFPDLKMGFIVFSNLGDVNVYEQAYKMADLFITDVSAKAPARDIIVDSSKVMIKDESRAKDFAGSYISDDGAQFSFPLRDHKLYWERGGRSDILYTGPKDSFFVAKSPEVKFVFHTADAGKVLVDQYWPENHRLLMKYSPDSVQDQQRQEYAGVYYSPELDCKYTIILKDHALVLTNVKYDDSKLKLVAADHLFTDYWWMGHLKIIRDGQGKIIGFEVNDGRIRHLRFNKIQ